MLCLADHSVRDWVLLHINHVQIDIDSKVLLNWLVLMLRRPTIGIELYLDWYWSKRLLWSMAFTTYKKKRKKSINSVNILFSCNLSSQVPELDLYNFFHPSFLLFFYLLSLELIVLHPLQSPSSIHISYSWSIFDFFRISWPNFIKTPKGSFNIIFFLEKTSLFGFKSWSRWIYVGFDIVFCITLGFNYNSFSLHFLNKEESLISIFLSKKITPLSNSNDFADFPTP